MALPSFPWLSARPRGAWCRSALARDVSLQGAVDAVTQQLAGAGRADLALVFAYSGFASDLPRLLPLLSQRVQADHWLGCCGGGVVGDGGGVAECWAVVGHRAHRIPAHAGLGASHMA